MKIDPIAIIESNLREQVELALDQLPPLLMWGDFIFQLSTMAYSKLTVQDGWSWASQGLVGRRDKLLYTGKKAPTLKFDCELYDEFVNDSLLTRAMQKYGMVQALAVDPVEFLRAQANLKQPLMLVTGTGKVMGYWVMTDISQVMDAFRPDSQVKHQMVTLSMQFYGEAQEGEQAAIPTGPSKEEKIRAALQRIEDAIAGVVNG